VSGRKYTKSEYYKQQQRIAKYLFIAIASSIFVNPIAETAPSNFSTPAWWLLGISRIVKLGHAHADKFDF